ncbi:hypothetical protein [Pseudomonas putida]|uniref:Uncharacterized protein n=1 Tax=Pseudomonas putida TaxID=303 RepID=A0A8I1JHX4_PSEPU|nr:hypothetical protein [Pseudomonas putida]MBI6882368.1 hypothetical protein [Pseudomonas putida]
MSIMTPSQFMESDQSKEVDHSAFSAHNARMRAQLNQRHGTMPDSFVVPAACTYIEKLTKIQMTSAQLLEMLALYPAEKARISRFTTSDFTHCEMVKTGTAVKDAYLIADMLTHFLGRTRWPRSTDGVDDKAFALKLQRRAMMLGYAVGGCTSDRLSA